MLTYAVLSNFVFLSHFALFYFFACVINYYPPIFNVESVAVFLPHNFMELSSLPSRSFTSQVHGLETSSSLFGYIIFAIKYFAMDITHHVGTSK